MTNEEMFEVWAPAHCVFSRWAKPVLFAHLAANRPSSAIGTGWRNIDVSWAPAPSEQVALVIDLSGSASVSMGTALAARGYCPVPVYNACTGPQALVNLDPIMDAIANTTVDLSRMSLPDDAPPAFLLDADRLRGAGDVQPGRFDNRWMVFPQDFPSATFLLSRHVGAVWLIQENQEQPQEDLAHVLLRWHEAGIRLLWKDARKPEPPQPLDVRRPQRFQAMWYRLLAVLGLRRNSAGGFGSVVPQPSSGAG